jgi:hypothetical protein
MTLDGLFDLVARHRANHLLGYLSALEDEQGRNAADVELACGIRVLVDVQLHNFDLTRVSGGDLGDSRRKHQARPAPLRPKIHHDRLGLAGVDDLGLKRAVRYVVNIVCHEFPFVLEAAWSY